MIEIEVSPASDSAKRLVSLTVTSAPLKAPGKKPLLKALSANRPDFLRAPEVSCNSLKKNRSLRKHACFL